MSKKRFLRNAARACAVMLCLSVALAYYERKVKEEKNKMLVINNVRCKLLARVFVVINRKTPFVNTCKFAA